MMVISFKKGMAYPFFPVPMNELSDCVLDADLLWGHDFAYLRERLLAITEIKPRFETVEVFLLKNFQAKLISHPYVEFALGEIIRQPDQINLGKESL